VLDELRSLDGGKEHFGFRIADFGFRMAEEKHCGLRIWDGGRDGKNGQEVSRIVKRGHSQTAVKCGETRANEAKRNVEC